MNTASRNVAVLVAALAAAACQKKSAIEQLTTADEGANAADPVKLEVTAAKTEVALGDDVVLHFKLTNTGKAPVQVNVPRIDERSVTIRVRREGGGVAMISRNHAEISPDPRRPGFLYQAGDAKTLEPGQSCEQDVAVVAVEAGKTAYTPSYVRLGAPAPLAAPTIEITVKPADAAKPRLGVTFDTTHGPYTAVFRPDLAYNTVESFASLTKHAFYDGVKFHRILAGFMAQAGDPKGTGEGGPGYFIPFEAQPAKLPHRRGVMSMARTGIPRIGRQTAGSQFFLMFATRPDLDSMERDGGYTTFGEMTDGEETLKKLEGVPCGPNAQGEPSVPKESVLIKSATLVNLPPASGN